MAKVELENVCLTFRVTGHGPATLRDRFCARFAPRFGNPIKEIHTLRDVNMTCRNGDRVAIVGANGAGKSTLLRLLADVYPATRGRRVVEGRIGSLFNITLGFEPLATGWQNIRYRCYLQGDAPRTVRQRMKEIAEFSELGEYLDMPVHYYSAGMRIRLAFSIATAIEPDILLVDEVIGAGDMSFRAKALDRIRDIMAGASIVFVASHDLKLLRRICNRAVWLHQGVLRADGTPKDVIKEYVSFYFRTKNTPETDGHARRAA